MDVTECENCGGLVVFDANTEAVKCPFCGDVSLTAAELKVTEQPDHAVPFQISPQDAEGLFGAWARSSFWAPRELRNQSAEIERLWVPAWRVNAEVHATWTGLVDAKTRSGKRPKAGIDVSRREVWVPASLGLSQDELHALAPFPEDGSVEWDPHNADAPFEVGGLTAQTATTEARPRFREAVRKDLIRRERLRDCRTSVLLEDVEATPLMLPVYVGCVRFRDRPWRFVINGQTGRVTGDTPLDRKKVAVALLAAVAAALVWLWLQR